MNVGDVAVVAVASDHVIRDIAFNCPKGILVIVPAEQAARSKDLHRDISQRVLWPMQGHPTIDFLPPSASPHRADIRLLQERVGILELAEQRLKDRNAFLESENSRLEAENQKLRVEATSDHKLDLILAKLQEKPAPPLYAGVTPTSPLPEVVGGEAPMFIPETGPSPSLTEHIEVKAEVKEGGDVSNAASKLRSIRRKNG